MSDVLGNKLVLVTRHTRIDDLLARYNTIDQVRFYVEHLGADFGDYELEHRTYHAAVRAAEAALGRLGRVQRIDRAFLPNFIFPPATPVVVLGQDGLVANTLKYLSDQRVVGVNPEPARWDGVLLPFAVDDLDSVLPEVLADRRPVREISMAGATLADGQVLHAVNDLFVGARSHVSARYRLQVAGSAERHSSSGIIISTGLGSTGWFRSVLTGAIGISGGASAEVCALRDRGFAWNSDYLYYSVREPFPSRTTRTEHLFGRIAHDAPLRLVSEMAGNGVIFSDGIEDDFLEFNSGMEATIAVAARKGRLVV